MLLTPPALGDGHPGVLDEWISRIGPSVRPIFPLPQKRYKHAKTMQELEVVTIFNRLGRDAPYGRFVLHKCYIIFSTMGKQCGIAKSYNQPILMWIC
jgi:hypothetical protein